MAPCFSTKSGDRGLVCNQNYGRVAQKNLLAPGQQQNHHVDSRLNFPPPSALQKWCTGKFREDFTLD